MADDIKARKITMYTATDNKCVADIMRIKTYQEYGLTEKEVRALHSDWSRFFLQYVDSVSISSSSSSGTKRSWMGCDRDSAGDQQTVSLVKNFRPRQISPSAFFPVRLCGSIGKAGSGKTIMACRLLSQTTTLGVTSPANKPCLDLLHTFMNREYPGGKTMEQTYTHHKALDLSFHSYVGRQALTRVSESTTLKKAQLAFLDMVANVTPTSMAQAAKQLFDDTMPILLPVVRNMVQAKKDRFLAGGFKYRLSYKDPTHPLYQDPNDTFVWVNNVDSYLDYVATPNDKLNKDEAIASHFSTHTGAGRYTALKRETPKEIHKRRILQQSITNQEEYVQYVLTLADPHNMPPTTALNDFIYAEEDSKADMYILYLYFISWLIDAMIYNVPYRYHHPPTYITSGSDAQLPAVGSTASPITYISAPNVLSDTLNTTVFRSELFRRTVKNKEDILDSLTRIPIIALEGHMPLTKKLLASFDGVKADPKVVSAVRKDGVHIFTRHCDITDYNNRVQETADGLRLFISDFVYVHSNVIPTVPYVPRTSVNEESDLSALTPSEARHNLGKLWGEKMRVYNRVGVARDGSSVCERVVPYDESVIKRPSKDNVPVSFTYDETIDVAIKTAMSRRAAQLYRDNKSIDHDSKRLRTDESDHEYLGTLIDEIKTSEGRIHTTYKNNIKRSHAVAAGCKLNTELDNTHEQTSDTDDTANTSDEDDDNDDLSTSFDPKQHKPIIHLFNKTYVSAPMNVLLSTEEHKQHRIYAHEVVKYLDDGSRIANRLFRDARALDQVAPFHSYPQGDMAIVYASPCHEEFEKNNRKMTAPLKRSMVARTTALHGYLCYERVREFRVGSPLYILDTAARARIVGVTGTLSEIISNKLFSAAHRPLTDAFKILFFNHAITQYRTDRLTVYNSNCVPADSRLLEEYEKNMQTMLADCSSRMDNSPIPQVVVDAITKYVRIISQLTGDHSAATSDTESHNRNRWRYSSAPVTDLNAVLNMLQVYDPEYFKGKTYNFNVFTSPLYSLYRTTISSSSVLINDHAENTSKPTILGDVTHPIMRDVIREKEMLRQNNYGGQTLYRGEMLSDSKGRVKMPSSMIECGLERFEPRVLYRSSAVLLINGSFICYSLPRVRGGLEPNDVFTPPKYRKPNTDDLLPMGYMGRMRATGINAADSSYYHRMFTLHVGEDIAYPRPFVRGQGNIDSGVMVSPFAPSTPPLFYAKLSTLQEKDAAHRNSYPKLQTLFTLVGAYAPFTPALASTSYAIQGETINGKVYCDFSKFLNKRGQLILGPYETRCETLVVSTRANKTENFVVSNVDKLEQALTAAHDKAPHITKLKRLAAEYAARFEIVR